MGLYRDNIGFRCENQKTVGSHWQLFGANFSLTLHLMDKEQAAPESI